MKRQSLYIRKLKKKYFLKKIYLVYSGIYFKKFSLIGILNKLSYKSLDLFLIAPLFSVSNGASSSASNLLFII